MLNRLPIAILTTILLVLLGLFFLPSLSQNAPTLYQCPPCGCSLDNTLFDHPGECVDCKMQLFPVKENYAVLYSLVKPLLRNHHTQIYSKLIYPSFIIGLFLGILSLIGLKQKSFHPFLGSILLIIALYGFKNQLYGVDYSLSNNFRWLFTPISFITMLGPLVLIYIKSHLEEIRWEKKYILHLIPAGFFWGLYLFLIAAPDSMKNRFMSSPFETSFGQIEQLLAVTSIFFYTHFALKHINQAENLNVFQKRWLQRFGLGIWGIGLVWLLVLGLNSLMYEMGVTTLTYYPLWFSMGLLIYWVLIEAIIKPQFFFNRSIFQKKLNISPKMDANKAALLYIMTAQKPFKDPALSLLKLADQLNMTPKQLSALLNQGFNKNFYEFVNDYRVEEVKKLLLDSELKHLTLAAIANEAGFNSKSSFHSIFKKYTQMTPKQYLRQRGDVVEN